MSRFNIDLTVLTQQCRFFFSGIVTIDVGVLTFDVHKGLLVAKVPYFETRLKQCWNEKNHRIDFKQEKADVFKVFLNWLYTDTICVSDFLQNAEQKIYCSNFAACYQFADKVMCNPFKNAIVTTYVGILRKNNFMTSFSMLVQIARFEVPHNHLLRFSISHAVGRFMKVKNFTDNALMGSFDELKAHEGLQAQFLEGVWHYHKGPWKDITHPSKICEYHDHSDGSNCTKAKAGDELKASFIPWTGIKLTTTNTIFKD